MNIINKNKNIWDKYWNYYSPSTAERYLIEERNKVILRLFAKINRPQDKINVLEVGCGFASNSKILKGLGFEVFCIDTSEIVIRRIKKDIRYAIMADAARLPFGDNIFDLVFSAGLIEHYRMPEYIINEMVRVAKTNGIVLNFVPGAFSLWQAYRYTKLILGRWPHGYEENYTHSKLKQAYPKGSSEVLSGGIDFLSLKGLFIKLFNMKCFPDITLTKSAYTEIYYAASK